MTKKKKKEEKGPPRPKRMERRFTPQSPYNPWLVRGVGAVGAMGLGAGSWAYSYAHSFEGDEKLKPIPAYIIAAGAVLSGIGIWLGTSSDAVLRVGAPGIGMEKGDVRRMPWWAVSQIQWDGSSDALVIVGHDESGSPWTFKVAQKSNPEALAWIIKEAEARIPKKVKVPDSVLEALPRAHLHAGTRIELEPLQVVGRRCAASDKAISYEPDARVCEQCERVYFKRNVPKKCKCGAKLDALRTSVQLEDDENDDDDDELEDDDTSPDSEDAPESDRDEKKGARAPENAK